MVSIKFNGFSINVAKSKPKRNTTHKPVRISRLCKAVVILNNNNEYVAKINLKNDANHPDTLVIPFTKNSYELKGKEYVFGRQKDKYNHYVCHIRSKFDVTMFPGLDTQYSVFKPNIVVGGYIVRIDGKHYFNYTQFVSFDEKHPDYKSLITNDKEPVFYKNRQ